MSHKLSVYWAPQHDPAPALDYMHRLQPPVIRVMTEDVNHISQAFQAVPDAWIIPRVWRIDDDNGRAVREMNENPTEAAKRHCKQLVDQIDTWRAQAKERSLPFPPRNRIRLAGANEPNQGASYPVINDYARSYGYAAQMWDYGANLLLLGTGHPATPGVNWNNWSAFASLQPILDAGSHWVETHAYHQMEGPFHEWTDETGELRKDSPALAGRHHGCTLKAPHLIGEGGVDGTIFERDPQWGWLNYGIEPDAYAAQLEQAHDALAPFVVGYMPFELDHQGSEWWGYNIIECREQILAWALSKTDATDKPIEPDGDPINGTIIAQVLNVRSRPGPSGEVVDQLAHGVRVQIFRTLDVMGEVWYQIGPDRWAHGAWVQINNLPPDPRPKVSGIIDPTMAQAILNIEAGGKGFNADGSLKIRFEAHIFRKFFSDVRFADHFKIADSRPWAEPQYYRHLPGDSWLEIHTGDSMHENEALIRADSLDPEAAHKSISMGIAQIMGFNHMRVGYSSARAMYTAFQDSEAMQVVGFLNFLWSDPDIQKAIQVRDWRTIARLYNGIGNVDVYSGLLQDEYKRLVSA